jgi:hypothetical protein
LSGSWTKISTGNGLNLNRKWTKFLTGNERREVHHTGSELRRRLVHPDRPGTNVIKLFTAVIYEFSKKARVFVPGKAFPAFPIV